ncbi:MAG: phage tail protein [Acutalibacteraceae bacterium]
MAAENLGDILPNKMPPINVSAISKLRTGFNFVVMLNEFTYGFQSVSGIRVHRETMREQEGGVNGHMYLVGKPDDEQPTLTLERGYIIRSMEIVSEALYAAACYIPSQLGRKVAMLAANATSPVLSLENGPSTGLIMVFDRRQKLYAMFSFLSLGMIEWEFSNLSATSNDITIESITLAHTGIERIPLSWMPGFADAVNTWKNGSDDGMDAMREIVEENNRQFKERQKKIQELEKAKNALQEEHMKLYEEQVKLTKERNELNFNEDGSYKTQDQLKSDALARMEARKKDSDANLEAIRKEEAAAREEAEEKREAAKSDLQKALDEQDKKAKAKIAENAKKTTDNADMDENVKKHAESNEQTEQSKEDYKNSGETSETVDNENKGIT